MNRKFQIIVLLISVIVLSGCRKSSVDILYDKKYLDEIKAARKDIGFFLSRNYIPGGTFAIAKDGKIIYSEGVGLASQDLEVPVNRNTKFRIGEVSEVFTSAIYQRMVEDGILHPDSSVQHYLPDFPVKETKITLNQLANHTTGIRIETEDEENWRGLNISLQQGLDNFKNDPLQNYPDLFQDVSMFNYNLLGAVMEKATGKHFHNILKEYVTDTLHLSNTMTDNPLQTIKGRTDFYDYNIISQVVNATTLDLRYRAPSKGLLSNAEDLAKFGNAVFFSDYLSKETVEKMIQPVFLLDSFPAPIANAWILLATKEGGNMYGRKGSIAGGGAAILVIPKEKLVITGAINLTGRLDEIPVFEIASHFLTKKEDDEGQE